MTYNKAIIIGARAGSSRVKNKNIKLLNNIPLIVYTLKIAEQLKYTTYVSSDSDEILNIVKKYSSVKTIKRPEHLATKESKDLGWIKHLLTELPKYPDQLIFLRPTTPLRNINVIKDAIRKFDKAKNFTSLRSVEEMSESVYKTFHIESGYLKPIDSGMSDWPNQLLPISYKANGYIDILNVQHIAENDDLYGDHILPFITENTVEIDTENEFKYCEYILKNEIR